MLFPSRNVSIGADVLDPSIISLPQSPVPYLPSETPHELAEDPISFHATLHQFV